MHSTPVWGGPRPHVPAAAMGGDRALRLEEQIVNVLHFAQPFCVLQITLLSFCFPRRLADEGTVWGDRPVACRSCMPSIAARGESLLHSGIFDEPKGGKQATKAWRSI